MTRSPRRTTVPPSASGGADRTTGTLRSAEGEVGEAAEAGGEAVDGERGEGAGLAEVPHEVADRQVGADEGQQATGQDLAADPVAERAHQDRNLQRPGGENDRRGQQEGETDGIFAGQAAEH